MKDKTNVWKNYFRMLLDAGLPWKLMLLSFVLEMIISQMTLIFAEKLGTTLVEYHDIKLARLPLLILFLIGIAVIVIEVINAYIEEIVIAKIDHSLQEYAVDKIFYLKVKDIEKDDPRKLITRLVEDTSKSSKFLVDLAINEIPRLYYMIMALIQVISLKQPILTICTLAVVPIVFLGSFVAGKNTFVNRNNIQSKIAELTARLSEKIDNIEIIKSYNTQEIETTSGNNIIDELDKVKKQGVMIDQVNAFIKSMMWFIPLLVIIIPPALLMFNGEMNQGEFYAYILIVTTFRTRGEEHLTLWIYLKEAQGASLRLSQILNMETEQDYDNDFSIGDIEFNHVSFSYDDHKVLDDVSFVIEKGKKTALVGLSGSGKSTILNLIEKFYDPDSGNITINNQDIKDIGYKKYRDKFAYLPQNANGFSGTVRDMLKLSSEEDVDDNILNDVLKKCDLSELSLDDEIGYQGSKLSGGQRQKLGIGRMLLSESEYVLLDEATSALDVESTNKLQKLIDEKYKGKTQIVVTHDLSTVTNADKIILFSNGKIETMGKHEELLNTSNLYKLLFNKDVA